MSDVLTFIVAQKTWPRVLSLVGLSFDLSGLGCDLVGRDRQSFLYRQGTLYRSKKSTNWARPEPVSSDGMDIDSLAFQTISAIS